jgi:hypothetical protein
MQKLMSRFKYRIMDTKLFWRLWFWWGIRQARIRREAREAKQKTMPQLDTEQYWEKVHNERNRNL